jgi:hypothetical protein
MDPTTEAAAGGSEQAPVTLVQAPADAGPKLSLTEAARALRAARKPPEQPQASEQRSEAAAAEPAHESTAHPGSQSGAGAEDAGEPDAAPPGETESADPAAGETPELPPIEPPRSWTKEARERWASLPRETQEYLAEREMERDRDLNRRQSEAAEQRKALEAERGKVEQARQSYENALPQLLATLQAQQAGEFGDIRTIADLERLAAEDPSRYQRWDLAQKKIAAVQAEVSAAQQREKQEHQQRWSEFATRQDQLFAEKVPDMADAAKAEKLQKAAVGVLRDIGFTDDELAQSYHGQLGLSLRDHRVQLIVRDAILWREAQAKAKAASARPVPPVQRPGVAQGRGVQRDAELQNLSKQLDNASGVNALRVAAKMQSLKRQAAR